MTRIRVLLAAIAVPVTIAALVVVAQGAQASTPECTNGTYNGYCATQIDNGSPVLAMDNSNQQQAVDNPVIGWTDSGSAPATDWFQLAYAGDNSLGVMFFWAPTGVNLNLSHGRSGEWSRRAPAVQRVGLAAVDRRPGRLNGVFHLDEPRHAQDLAVRGQGLAAGDGYPVRNDLWQPGVEVQRLASDLTPCPPGRGSPMPTCVVLERCAEVPERAPAQAGPPGGTSTSFPTENTFQWTTPAGRQYATEPTCYPL